MFTIRGETQLSEFHENADALIDAMLRSCGAEQVAVEDGTALFSARTARMWPATNDLFYALDGGTLTYRRRRGGALLRYRFSHARRGKRIAAAAAAIMLLATPAIGARVWILVMATILILLAHRLIARRCAKAVVAKVIEHIGAA